MHLDIWPFTHLKKFLSKCKDEWAENDLKEFFENLK